MQALRDLLEHIPFQVLVPIAAAVPLLVYVLGRLRDREVAQSKQQYEAFKAGVGKQHLVLERIFIHPVKSCRGIEVQESAYTALGLEFDRQWALIDAETHKVVTARDLNKMVLVHPAIDREKGLLKLSIPSAGVEGLHVPLEPTAEDLAGWHLLDDVKIWSDTVDAYVVDAPEVHDALSSFLGRTVQLVMKGPSKRALASPAAENPDLYALAAPLPTDARTAFADGFPFLLVTSWSAQDVERKVALSASGDEKWAVKPALEGEAQRKWAAGEDDYLRRTRGNLVVGGAGGEAWMEDRWGTVEFGEEKLVVVSMCGRCQLPNIDPDTGVQHGSTPYKVISKFRRSDPVNKYEPCFGVNAVPTQSRGRLAVGDPVRVTKANSWVRASRGNVA